MQQWCWPAIQQITIMSSSNPGISEVPTVLLWGHSCSGIGLQGVHGASPSGWKAIVAWLVGDMVRVRCWVTRGRHYGKRRNSIWEDKLDTHNIFAEILQSPNPVWHGTTFKEYSWTTGGWRLPKWRRLETFVTLLATEGFWDKKGNGVMSPQSSDWGESRTDR